MLSLFKNAYGGLSREVWLLSLVMFINRAGTMVVAFLSVYLTQKLHFSVAQSGYVMMTFGLGAILGAYLGGRMTDRYGSYIVQFISLLIGGMIFFVMAELRDFYSLCICTFFLSLFGESYRPANTASIAHFSTPATFTRSVSLVRLAINLGWALGPAIGGFLAAYNYTLLFWTDGFTNILAAILVWIFLRTPIEKKIKLTAEEKSLKRSESAYKDNVFMVFIIFATCYGVTFFPLFTVIPLFYKQVCLFSEQQIGILMGINGLLVAVVEMILIYKIEKKFTKLQFIIIGCVLLMLNYIVFLFFTSYAWMVVGITLVTASEIFAMPFMSAFSMERAKPHNRGQYSALYQMTWSFAQVVAPLAGTQVIANYGYDALWYLFGGIALTAVLGFGWLRKIAE
jgi:predicted MFS family arabinose efflux permease